MALEWDDSARSFFWERIATLDYMSSEFCLHVSATFLKKEIIFVKSVILNDSSLLLKHIEKNLLVGSRREPKRVLWKTLKYLKDISLLQTYLVTGKILQKSSLHSINPLMYFVVEQGRHLRRLVFLNADLQLLAAAYT